MGRTVRAGAALLVALIAAAPSMAEEYETRSLAGLKAVRVMVTVAGALDPAEAEMVVRAQLAKAGFESSRTASSTVAAFLSISKGEAAADLSLVQTVCLERDPLTCARVPTWYRGVAERVPVDRRPADRALVLLAGLAEQLGRDWRAENPRR